MKSTSPVFDGTSIAEVVYAKDQPEYEPLPAVRSDKTLITRWKLTPDERKRLIDGEDLFIHIMHFGNPLQPLLPVVGQVEALECFLENNK